MLNFPVLPEYAFSWRTIYVEPIPESGEKIAIAVILKGVDNSLIATRIVALMKLKSVLGMQLSKRLNEALSVCLKSAESYYKQHPITSMWSIPLEGFTVGEVRQSLADNIDAGVIDAALQSSSIYLGSHIDSSELKLPTMSSAKWRDSILNSVTKIRKEWHGCFDKEIRLSGHGLPLKIGFMSDRYVAHFGTVSKISSQRNESLIRVQSKLWQLDRLRDMHDELFSPNRYELVMYKPKLSSSEDWLNEFFEEIEYESSRRDLSLYAASSPEVAANHVIVSAS